LSSIEKRAVQPEIVVRRRKIVEIKPIEAEKQRNENIL
jgi:hypothetical protein